jgi:hypothetical protein
MSEVNLNAPLNKLKDDIDALEVKIVGLGDGMDALKPFVKEFHEKKDLRRDLIKAKREKLHLLTIMSDYYKDATGEYPVLGPLFAQNQTTNNLK